MIFHRNSKAASKLLRILGVVGLGATSSLGLLATSQGAAHADTTATTLVSNSSWLNIGVRGGSTNRGTDIIQWWATGGGDQQWTDFHYTSESPSIHRFQNVNSGMCITTDGVAGDPLVQQPCNINNAYQVWTASYEWYYGGYALYSPVTGLNMDVQGQSYWGGAEIDAWYPNGQVNQVFFEPGRSLNT